MLGCLNTHHNHTAEMLGGRFDIESVNTRPLKTLMLGVGQPRQQLIFAAWFAALLSSYWLFVIRYMLVCFKLTNIVTILFIKSDTVLIPFSALLYVYKQQL